MDDQEDAISDLEDDPSYLIMDELECILGGGDENLSLLQEMGFKQQEASQALEECGNDLQKATNYLIKDN